MFLLDMMVTRSRIAWKLIIAINQGSWRTQKKQIGQGKDREDIKHADEIVQYEHKYISQIKQIMLLASYTRQKEATSYSFSSG